MDKTITYDVWYVRNYRGEPLNDHLDGPLDINSAYKAMQKFTEEDIISGFTKRSYEIRESA